MEMNDARVHEIQFVAQRPTYDHRSEYLVCFDDQALKWSLLSEDEMKAFSHRFLEHEYRFFKRCDLCLGDIKRLASGETVDNSFHLSGKIVVAPLLRFDKDIAIFEFVISPSVNENGGVEMGGYLPWHRVLAFGDLACACNDLFCENMLVDVAGYIRSSWCLLDADGEKEVCEMQLVAESLVIRGGLPIWQRDADLA